MDHLESIIHKHPFSKYFLFWYRYVGDILVCFSGTDRQLLNFVNNIHENIKFTVEIEQHKSIKLLDTDSIIPNSSNHPYSHKMAAFNSFIHRLLHIPMSRENYIKELNIIKQIAVNNEYRPDIINKIVKKKSYRQAINMVYPTIKTHKHNFKT